MNFTSLNSTLLNSTSNVLFNHSASNVVLVEYKNITKNLSVFNNTLLKSNSSGSFNHSIGRDGWTGPMNITMKLTTFNSTHFSNVTGNGSSGPVSPMLPEGSVTLASLVGILMLLTLIANIFVATVILYYPSLRTTTNHFIFNLCIADLLFAVTSMPIWLVFQLEPAKIMMLIPWTYLEIWGKLDVLCGTAAILSLAAISLDRYLAITRPLTYTAIMCGRKAIAFITLTWIYALLVALVRYADWPMNSYAFFCLVFSFVLPLAVILLCYGRIFLVAITHVRALQSEYTTRTKRELKAAQTIFIVIVSFVGCWLPFFVANICLAMECADISSDTLNAIKWLTYCNTLLNPLVYTLVDRKFRKTIARKLLARRTPNYSLTTQTVICEEDNRKSTRGNKKRHDR